MADQTLEERVAKLEAEMADMRAERLQEPPSPETSLIPWWKKIVGVYKDDPDFEEAMRLGREYRESHYPVYNEDES